MTALTVWALWSAVITGAALTVTLIPLARLVTVAKTEFASRLFKFLMSVATLQILNILTPLLFLGVYYSFVGTHAIEPLFIIATIALAVENVVVAFFALFMYRKLKDS